MQQQSKKMVRIQINTLRMMATTTGSPPAHPINKMAVVMAPGPAIRGKARGNTEMPSRTDALDVFTVRHATQAAATGEHHAVASRN